MILHHVGLRGWRKGPRFPENFQTPHLPSERTEVNTQSIIEVANCYCDGQPAASGEKPRHGGTDIIANEHGRDCGSVSNPDLKSSVDTPKPGRLTRRGGQLILDRSLENEIGKRSSL